MADEAWARHWLTPFERDLWDRQSNPDRRHAVGAAHDAAALLGDRDGAGVAREVLVAALLHDVGKIESGLGTFGRVGATVLAQALGRDRVAAWASPAGATAAAGAPAGAAAPASSSAAGASSGGGPETPPRRWRERAGRYVTHDQRGGRLLSEAGSTAFATTWTREHHQPEETWTLDPALTAILKEADGD